MSETTTYAEYWSNVDAIATEAMDARKRGDDPDDTITESVDGSYWVIYTHAAHATLMHSENESACFDDMGADALSGCEDFGSVMSRMAYFAMLADVRARYQRMIDEAEETDDDSDNA